MTPSPLLPVTLQDVGYERLLRPRLFKIGGGNPEAAHEAMIEMLGRIGAVPGAVPLLRALVGRPQSPIDVAGIHFPGRVGVAAGLDKDGIAARTWAGFGFGFAELGTVTAHAQPGNPSPRMFRLRHSRAILNRMGFNNRGAVALAERLRGWGVRRGEQTLGIPLGISIGKTKVVPVEDAVADYLASLEAIAPYADYVAINVSSPNTPDLRSLQERTALAGLTGALVSRAHQLGGVPVFVKVAPDLTDGELDDVLSVAHETGVSGLVLTNTTLARDGLAPKDQRWGQQAGGLSGDPLTLRSRAMVRRVAHETALPIIGSGGIMTPSDALAMLEAGASLVEVYSGFIYGGTALVSGTNALLGARSREALGLPIH